MLRIRENEIIHKVELLKEYEALQEEVAAEINAIKNELKETLDLLGTEELEAGQYIVRYSTIISNRLDTTLMKRTIPQVYAAYVRQVTSRRFSIT